MYAGGNPYGTSNPNTGQQSSGGGGFSFSNLPISNFTGGSSGPFSGLTSGINNFGTGLGFAPGTLSYTTAGALPWQVAGGVANPAMAGVSGVGATSGSLTGATLGSTLGAASLGAGFGGLLAGMTGGNTTGGTIGGGIGAAVGNMIAPGIGGIVGGLLGGIGGGMFGGGKPSDKTMAGGVSLGSGDIDTHYATTQSSTGKKFSQENATFRDQLQSNVSQFSKFLLQNGATPKNPNSTLVMVNGSRDGLRYFVRTTDEQGNRHDTPLVNTGQDAGNYYSQLSNALLEQYDIPPALKAQLNQMNLSTTLNPGVNSGGQAGGFQGGGYSVPSIAPKKVGPTFEQFYSNYTGGKSITMQGKKA
jgi:hypothetical protein